MARLCKSCLHPERLRIESQVVGGGSIEKLAKANGLHPMGLRRHMKRHAAKDLALIDHARSEKAGSALLERIHGLADECSQVLKQAKKAKSLDAANGAIGQALRAMELIGRITGEVPTGSNNINIALGVRMDVAQQSVQIVKDAQSIEPREVIERALRCVRAWNATHPEDSVSI